MMTDKHIVVVGAGLMGTGITHAFLASGHHVTLVDTNGNALDQARQSITKIFGDGVRLGKTTEADVADALARMACAEHLRGASGDTALVMETVTESLVIKQAIVREAEACFKAGTVIATNTSALSITEIASVAKTPAHVIGMHFFNPVHKMKLVEIVRGLETSDETVARARAWASAIGKTSIEVNEAPGFTTSRISALLGNEAMYMLSEGVASAEDIDTSLRMAFNHPMGPLELGDLTGWDTRLAVLQYLHQTLGEKFRPCPLIIKLVKAGRHGRKTGRGIYEYDDKGAKIPNSGVRPF
ncbi:MAG: 3-hydroxyacyl-CoA dehydrogenase [Betaproteobacteria bacterium]|jgi:3-hydroxybutyryl-CoA dehydrogenase|nr:3-hydroxyacyl-CoA dehydrogenase [Betaproteobacteria bacterium]